MLTLCGFPLSNYYNKVKLVLLEKGIDFTEERVATGGRDAAVLADSPLGKVPFIRTEHGAMSESQAIVDWIEAAWPEPPLVPADPWQRAKLAELVTYVDLHLELVARELYAEAFFGGKTSDDDESARAQAAAAPHRRLRRGWRSSRRMSPATASRKPTAPPTSACRWSRCRPSWCSARTCSPPPASTGRPTSS